MLLDKPMRKGQTISRKEIKLGEREYKPQVYIVVKDYPYHTVVKDWVGFLRSISHAELLILGIVKQPAHLECWRR